MVNTGWERKSIPPNGKKRGRVAGCKRAFARGREKCIRELRS